MKHRKSERGQAIIMIVLAMVGLIAITGLTVDGGIAYSDRRNAQNAADSAAFAGALAHTRHQTVEATAAGATTINGYDNNGTSNVVTISTVVSPEGSCPPEAVDNLDVTVQIVSHVGTTFGTIVGINQVTNTVTATTRACGAYVAPLFGGNAIVGLSDSLVDCAYDSGSSDSAHWKLTGGGIFSNGCADSKNGDSVTLDDGQCVTAVGPASNFTCSNSNQTEFKINYPDDVLAIMPPNPCDGTPGDVGLAQPAASGGSVYMADGVYCISNFDAYDSTNIILNNATMYVTDTVFSLKFAGGGGFSGTPSYSGPYNSYYMIIAYKPNDPCTAFNDHNAQQIQYRGNGGGVLSGTILAPSACIDYRGNADSTAVHSQLIGYMVTSNGNGEVAVNYQTDEERREPVNPTITLLK